MVVMCKVSTVCRLSVTFGSIIVGLVQPFVPVLPVVLRRVGGGSTSSFLATSSQTAKKRSWDCGTTTSCPPHLQIRPPRRSTSTSLKATGATTDVKQVLLAYLAKQNSDELRVPCGLECTNSERDQIATLIADLEQDPRNLVLSRNRGIIEAKEVLGEWELIYTSSRTMAINKSLSGLGRSTSDLARFSGMRQTLTGSK